MQRRSRFDLTRRRLLQSLGLGAVAGPLIPLLNADAQTATRPKRLLLLFTPDGTPALNYSTSIDWRPTGTETAFTLQSMSTPLEPFKAKIVIPGGLTMSAGGAGEGHAFGMAGLWSGTTLPGPGAGVSFDGGNGHLTGWGAAATIDQIVAQAFGPGMPYAKAPTDASQETRYRSIALGVQCGGPNTLNRMTYSGANAPISPEVSPKAAFDRYFAGVTPTAGGTAPPPLDPTAARVRAEQQAVLNLLKGEMPKIRAMVGTADFQKIDAHLEGLAALERLNGVTGGTPVPPAPGANCVLPPASADVASPSNNAGFPTQVTQMMDITTALLSCDVTRVLTLQLSYAFSNVVHTWLGHTKGHHTLCHDGIDERTPLSAIDLWYSQQVAYLLGKLDAVNEGNGTLLDNTLVVWGHENGTTAHRQENVPLLLAGKAGGALRTGRYVNAPGKPHAMLLVSIAQLMGLPLTSVGNINMNSGPLPGLV
jgi:Protein of unknown function (DUF1552)